MNFSLQWHNPLMRNCNLFVDKQNELADLTFVIRFPRKCFYTFEVTFLLAYLHSLDDVQVRHINFTVFWEVKVLFSHQNSLLEEVFVNHHTILFRHQHFLKNKFQNKELKHAKQYKMKR